MHELTDQELYKAFAYARSLSEDQGKQIMAKLMQNQPGLYQTLFGFLPDIIAEQQQDMAHLFMDLCFDVVCVFQYTFGDPVHNGNDPVWLEKQAALLGADLQVLHGSNMANEKAWANLQNRFTTASPGEITQAGLINVLHEAIDEHAASNTRRVPVIPITQGLMSVAVKLIGSLYVNQR